ncbi:MAG TPA: M20/M25/M40 family metallo-hydrolase [Daejeonella sp.]|nr:M20/M25/M40 family metallo-hydrolase [Daejeonella sp.]
MKKNVAGILAILSLASCSVQKPEKFFKNNDVERIIRTLASDEMQGRATFTPGIEKAANFIENEFKEIGLKPLNGESGFRQTFWMTRLKPGLADIAIGDKKIADENVLVVTNQLELNLSNSSGVEIARIKAGENFQNRYRSLAQSDKPVIVLVDASFGDIFKRIKANAGRGRLVQKTGGNGAAIFVLGVDEAPVFSVKFKNQSENLPLFNVAGMIPGKSKEKELVVFSGHYDHLGIIKPVGTDSIANGADDDASGVTAMISLAKYYKKLNNNQRTLIFVAFTAEEIGGFGSRYFCERLNPDDVVAMFNIEMIGKDSKFGPNTAFITGYERSDFGQILQKNLEGTAFKFYPDPYPEQNLFYRSDNATLAALGVPAHTISTVQIDGDKYYHTVKDEFETLDVNNISATIKAIALSAQSIISGQDTPKRIPKLKE